MLKNLDLFPRNFWKKLALWMMVCVLHTYLSGQISFWWLLLTAFVCVGAITHYHCGGSIRWYWWPVFVSPILLHGLSLGLERYGRLEQSLQVFQLRYAPLFLFIVIHALSSVYQNEATEVATR